MDTKLRHMCGLKLYRADIAQGLMEPLSIVEHLDEFKYRGLRRLMGPEVLITTRKGDRLLF
ncbi:MAG: hypothetical protein NTNFB02_00200 [Nitrospira sp.]